MTLSEWRIKVNAVGAVNRTIAEGILERNPWEVWARAVRFLPRDIERWLDAAATREETVETQTIHRLRQGGHD